MRILIGSLVCAEAVVARPAAATRADVPSRSFLISALLRCLTCLSAGSGVLRLLLPELPHGKTRIQAKHRLNRRATYVPGFGLAIQGRAFLWHLWSTVAGPPHPARRAPRSIFAVGGTGLTRKRP